MSDSDKPLQYGSQPSQSVPASSRAQVVEEQLKLKKEQIEIEAKFGYRVVGLSLFDTVIEVGTCNSRIS